jgi:hypothetical protein
VNISHSIKSKWPIICGVLTHEGYSIHILDDEWIQTCRLDRMTCFLLPKFVYILILVLENLYGIDFQNSSLLIFYCSKNASTMTHKTELGRGTFVFTKP